MTYTISDNGVEVDGVSYPFAKPEGFDTWLKTRQDAFVAGVLHVYTGQASSNPLQPTPTEEILL